MITSTTRIAYTLHQRIRETRTVGAVEIEHEFVWASEDGEIMSPVFGTMDAAASHMMLDRMMPTGKKLEDL